MSEHPHPHKWKAGPPTTRLSAEELILMGYVKISNAYGLVSRIDRPDWLEFLARHYRRAPADFCVVTKEGLVPAPNWGAHYLKFSKDTHTVPYDVIRKMPSSACGAKYVELPKDEQGTVFNIPMITCEVPKKPSIARVWAMLTRRSN